METMLARKNEEMVSEYAVFAEVARAGRIYVYVSCKRFFVLHLLHLSRLDIQSKLQLLQRLNLLSNRAIDIGFKVS